MAEAARHPRTLRLGTRGSKLARWQAEWVADRLQSLGCAVELVEIATRGDVERVQSIEEIGTRGVFTKEIQRALLAGEVDLAVHSLKDLPTEPVDGLMLAAVPERESPSDVLICRGDPAGDAGGERSGGSASNDLGARLRLDPSHPGRRDPSVLKTEYSVLPDGAGVGTGSLRRQAQLRHLRPDLEIADVRGNVDTRLRKLDDGQFDAIILAEAGLTRLGLADRITQVLPFEVMLPAVGQGALGVECRTDDSETRAVLANLDDRLARAAVTAERSLLEHLRGGCMAPIGAIAQIDAGKLHLSAVVLSADGAQRLAADDSDSSDNAAALGRRVADALLAKGAATLISESRKGT
jgi:hydroxymethylbilane synthase